MAPEIERVLQVHTRYRFRGGEDEIVDAERRLLEGAGIAVTTELFANPDATAARSVAHLPALALNTISSREAARRVRHAIRTHRPDVVHVHNTFVAASPSVYYAAAAERVPVLQSLHNFRFVCPAATTFRDGHPCTDCVGRMPWPAVLHACYRESRPQSALVAATLGLHRLRGTYRNRIAAYVTLTAYQRNVLVRGGLPGDSIGVLPNFLEPDPGTTQRRRGGFLYVGRLSEEKGIATLLAAATRRPAPLRVAGDGPYAAQASEAAARGELEALGRIDRDAVIDELAGATALVFPSLCPEGPAMSVLEAFATATPVIAAQSESIVEVVEDGVTGLLARLGDPDDLASKLRWAGDHPDEMAQMGANARRAYEERYRGEGHLRGLLEAYGRAREVSHAVAG